MLHTTDRPQGCTRWLFDRILRRARLGRHLHLVALALVVLAASTAGASSPAAPLPAGQDAGEVVEHWYRIDVGPTPAGWMLVREERRDDRLTTTSILHLRFKRGPSAQTLQLESRFVETADGRPLSAWARQDLGMKPVETSWEMEHGTVWVETTRDGTTRRERRPWPKGDWLTPGQLQERLADRVASGAESFTLTGLDPQLGLEAVETRWQLDRRDAPVVVGGETLPAIRFRQRQTLAPQLETVLHVNASGRTLRSVTPMMGLEMTLTLSTREDVLAHRETPELLLHSFLYPDRPIPNPRRARRAVYEIESEPGALGDLPSTGDQRIVRSEGGQRLVVEVGSSPRLTGEERPDREEHLRSSTLLDHQDPAVRRLTEGVELPADASARAEALRQLVAEHLGTKDLDSILATASEVAASGSGDCTEHSVLLAALLRAEGIPSRGVTGLVYVEELLGQRDLFGYHMWTQALIDERWVDLDATLARPFDAAHIALGTSALNDGSSALGELSRLATLIGNARIRVLEVEH